MRKEPSQETIEALNAVAKHLGAEYYTISTPIICDHCQNEDEEAFPYYVKDRDGREWAHLCNGCFDELGCAYDFTDEEWWPEEWLPGSLETADWPPYLEEEE